MKKSGVWGIAIIGAFLLGIFSANPVVEAVGGWQAAFDLLDARITALENLAFPGSQVYEVSANGIILEGENFLSQTVQVFCLDGDWVNIGSSATGMTHRVVVDEALIFDSNAFVNIETDDIREDNTSRVFPKNIIGKSIRAEYGVNGPENPPAPFDIPFTVTILCFSPSS